MLKKACLVLGLFAATVVLSGCTPAVQSEEATTGVRGWSNMTAAPGTDVVDVEVSPHFRTPRRAPVPANMTTAAPRPTVQPTESPQQRVSRLETRLQRLQKELAKLQQELARLRKQQR